MGVLSSQTRAVGLSQNISTAKLGAALDRARSALLSERAAGGYWVGEISSSALATATAIVALTTTERARGTSTFRDFISRGTEWLIRNSNPDGGWGDTTRSLSNISTTVLCWAALRFSSDSSSQVESSISASVSSAERWLNATAGGTTPEAIASAILRRYGKDRTFSIPILTVCALSGCLGSERPWRQVLPLPFELAALPRGTFAALRLPVVSYALPALIAMGYARHFHEPSRNPVARLLRNATAAKALRVLGNIQPVNGGFLEATPLTSFVTLSLASAGQENSAVVARAIDFLLKSQRSDGCWPIDTNLTTWVTTLSLNAFAKSPPADFPSGPVVDWILRQQYREVHPYTHAAPGGWAWTDLPGGVPDTDDTAGALLALGQWASGAPGALEASEAGIEWLLGLQNRDGGIPTFCRGWGALPFDRSAPDLTAHAMRAWLIWLPNVSEKLQRRILVAMRRALNFLRATQRSDGAWIPLWFGNEAEGNEENPVYGTSRVMLALSCLATSPIEALQNLREKSTILLARAAAFLVANVNHGREWGGTMERQGSIEETAWATEALALSTPLLVGHSIAPELKLAVYGGASALIHAIETGDWLKPAPLGFYFAKLWYYERLYPQIFTVAALNQTRELVEAGYF